MSLEWLVDPTAGFDQSRPPSSREDPNDEQQEVAFPGSTRSCWRQDALQPRQVLQGIAGRVHVAISLIEVCDEFYLEHWEYRQIGVFLAEKQEVKLEKVRNLFDNNNNILCFQEVQKKGLTCGTKQSPMVTKDCNVPFLFSTCS